MIRAFLVLLLATFFATPNTLDAQRYKDARTYYREFQNENRRIQIKNMRYLEAVARSEDPRRINKYREMVVEQLTDSERAIEIVGPYGDDEVLHREYMDALAMYIEAFSEDFEKAEKLTENRYASYADLQLYYEAANAAEIKMIDAAYKIEKAEDYFAKTYLVDLRRDQELLAKAEKLDVVTLYTRDLTLAFFKVDAEIRALYKAFEEDNTDTVQILITNLRKALRASQSDLKELELTDEEIPDMLQDELESYLEDVDEAIDEELSPLADRLQNKFLDQNDYQDAQRDFADFKEWHQEMVEEYFITKNELIDEVLGEE
jgi:hypothetical protein